HRFRWPFVAVMLGVGAVLCLPILIGALRHTLTGRYEEVGMLTQGYRDAHGLHTWWEIADAVLANIGAHLTAGYLFVHGDHNPRHSTGWVGELSWIDDAALVLGLLLMARTIWRRGRLRVEPFFLLCLAGFVIGTLPAAITMEGIPHALRSCCCWPFMALISGCILERADARWCWTAAATALVAAAFAAGFYRNYFNVYPHQVGGAYDEDVKHAAVVGRDRGDWSGFIRLAPHITPRLTEYYLIQYAHLPLKQAADVPAALALLRRRDRAPAGSR
ncbi:MAG TPA: hypothetical protein VFE31_05860, partial [Opitutaceae bacterium]|nr:hypothetical protein [Opitutaceae bacterium]